MDEERFLDYGGLKRYDNRTKEELRKKQDRFEIDETLTRSDENVLGVSLPVKAITKDKYNALSEEEKMTNVQWMITDDEDGVGGIEIGDTLVDADGVIDVKTPVNGVITQKDFDALPPEKQKHGLYVIPGTGDGIDGALQEIYSIEETKVGRWIDGKPLYRNVLIGRTGSGTTWIKFGEIQDLDVLVYSIGYCVSSDGFTSVPNQWVAFSSNYSNDKNGIWAYSSHNNYKNVLVYLIVYYTKTIDEATIEIPIAASIAHQELLNETLDVQKPSYEIASASDVGEVI